MPRIATAGFQHETNSFGTGRAGLAEFETADSWPALLTGSEVTSGTRGMNLPIAGFTAVAEAAGAELFPILWCAAEPSGLVTDEAFDTIARCIISGLRRAEPLDGIYLDLHGAMITDSHDDGEGALLTRIREEIGPSLPIAVSLDMHANISAKMVELSDEICIFKTYPHLDMAEAGARCWARLQPMLRGVRPAKSFRRGLERIPLHAQVTSAEPARSLYDALPDRADTHVEMALGFTAADTSDAASSVIAYAQTQAESDALADAALARLFAAKEVFDTRLTTAEEAVACAVATSTGKPVVLADVQDNPGAGASSDTTGLLRALIDGKVQTALLGLMHDPYLAKQAHAAGIGAVIEGALGGRSGIPEDRPFNGRFRVTALSEGYVPYTGAMYGGGIATLGATCALHVEDVAADVTVVVTSIRNQCLDLAQFKHLNLSPEQARVIVIKSTAHFRADFEPIASKVISVSSPGLFPCEPPFSLTKRGFGDAIICAPG
ncbi:M81 family metallopeptidase [Ruegeria sp. 2205SS24-7]|uniref:M81 family metallopeptidase n=1 Tax=Ruegeria discodermiae TaxID=3064389 RepID=UPI0027407041|nr:M81 family metallopeptidase [Ruegeria sp. 2205SS24-7]MDP5215696.1 M81 family metallopeptidase [Ruegeria sp. 2205SS24-7]